MRDGPRASVRGAPGAALVLCLLLNQGFDWPRRGERLVNTLTSASTPRDRRDALRLLDELAARKGLPADLDLSAVEATSRNVDPDVRAEAWSLLAHVRPEPDSLEPALRDPSPIVRRVALRELARLAPSHDSLLRSVTDPDSTVRTAGVAALALRSDPRAVTMLASALRDASIEVRVAALRALGQRSDPEAMPLIASAGDDPLPELRAAALDALAASFVRAAGDEPSLASGRPARVDTPPERAALATCGRALDDQDQAVVLAALRCLERAQPSPRAPDGLASSAQDPRVMALARSFFPVVASAATHLLERERVRAHGDEAGAALEPDWLPLLERTADRSLAASDAARIVDALEALVPAGETLVADPLLEWLPRAPRALSLRVAALIERTHATIAAQPVLALLSAAPASARASYVRLLASTRGAETDARLLVSLDDPQPDVRQAAVFAAARALGSTALPRLLERLEDAQDTRRRDTLVVLAALLERLPRTERALTKAGERALVGALQHDLAQHDEVNAALAVRALGALASERARAVVRTVLDDARPGRNIAALRASTSDRGLEARQGRERLLAHHDARVAATALVALTLAQDPIPARLAVEWLHNTAWPRGPAASFALMRAASRQDAPAEGFEPCAWLASDEPITRSNMIAALQQRPSDACPRPDVFPLPAWLEQHAASPRRADEPAALILEDSSVIVSVPDASGRVDWPDLRVATEVSAFLASGGPM